MRKFLGVLVVMAVSGIVLAEGEAAAAAAPLITITPGLSMAIAAGLCGLAMGKGIAAACEGIARNPAATGNIRTTLLIGLAFIESVAIYTLVSLFF